MVPILFIVLQEVNWLEITEFRFNLSLLLFEKVVFVFWNVGFDDRFLSGSEFEVTYATHVIGWRSYDIVLGDHFCRLALSTVHSTNVSCGRL